MEPNNEETKVVAIRPLNCKWVLYYHLPSDKSWTLSSYVAIDKNIDSAEKVVAINTLVPDHVLYGCMFFCMKDGITPMWEDPQNKNGGCFSYRILNKTVPAVWRKLLALLCGNSLCSNKKHEPFINGITVSPKKNFCIVKIWLNTCKFQDPTIIRDVIDLPRDGCLFKNHAPEF